MTLWWRKRTGGDDLYTAMCDRIAADVIAEYSTSFTLASRLLSPPVRRDVANLYAVVRIADEIVDGAAAGAVSDAAAGTAHTPEWIRGLLDNYADAVVDAPDHPFHTDPVLHAWAGTARRCHLDPDHMRAFFASMRADVDPAAHDDESLATYIHGSAGVIGLMCLDIFTTHGTATGDPDQLRAGAASLGSAFQKINFLRDIGVDTTVLHRSYLPDPFTEAAKTALLDECVTELDAGCACISALPRGARAGVAAASALYRELAERLRATPVERLTGPDAVRVSVSPARKALLTTQATVSTTVNGVCRG